MPERFEEIKIGECG